MDFKRFAFFYALLLSLFFMGLTYFFLGFFFSEYEGLNIGLLSGSLTPGMPFRSVYFSGNLVISQFYSLFYEYLPGVEWISWFEYLWMMIACTLAIYTVNKKLPTKTSLLFRTGFSIVLYLLVFVDHTMHLIYTRVAYLTCGVSLITLVAFFGDTIFIKKNWKWFALLQLFFVLGTFIRNEAALACLCLLAPFSLFYLKDIRQTLVLFLLPATVVCGQSLFLAIDISHAPSSEFYKQVEPDIEEQFTARGNIVPLSDMKTQRDSAIYLLAKEMVLSDPKVMTAKYLRTLIKRENFIFTDARQWTRVFDEQKIIVVKYWYLVLIVLLLSLSIGLSYNFREQKWVWVYYLAFVLSFWGLTVVQTYVDKVNERSWLPYIGLFILCHFLLMIKIKASGYSSNRPFFIIAAACSCLFIIHIYHIKKESDFLKTDYAFQQRQLNNIKAIASGSYLVINSSIFNYLFLSNRPFCPFNFSDFKRVYITDSYVIPFFPYYKRYLEKECGCDIYAYPSFWQYLKDSSDKVVIISSESRINIIHGYLKQVHQLDLPIQPLVSPQESYNVDWHAWTIGK